MPSIVPIRTLRMDEELYQKLKFIAKREERSYNQEAVYILKKYVDQYETTYGKIRDIAVK